MATIKMTKAIISKMNPNHTPMIQGDHGTGKTEVVRQLCEEVWKLPCVELQGSQLSDVGDLIGLQKISTVEAGGEKYEETTWVPPYWYPKNGKPFCLFLDEINRAAPPIKRAMMQIGNDHKLLNFNLPEGSRVICAVNPDSSGEYDVEEFDAAERDRFFKILFTPTVAEWLDWARAAGVLDVITSYIDAHNDDLDPFTRQRDSKAKAAGANTFNQLGVLPSRRSWKKLSDDMKAVLSGDPGYYDSKEGVAELKLLAAGWIGEHIANNFASWYAEHCKGIKPSDIVEAGETETKIWEELKKMAEAKPIETVSLGKSVAAEIHKIEGQLSKDHKPTETGIQVAANWLKFLTAIPLELATQVNMQAVETARSKKERWVGMLSAINTRIRDFYMELADFDV